MFRTNKVWAVAEVYRLSFLLSEVTEFKIISRNTLSYCSKTYKALAFLFSYSQCCVYSLLKSSSTSTANYSNIYAGVYYSVGNSEVLF